MGRKVRNSVKVVREHIRRYDYNESWNQKATEGQLEECKDPRERVAGTLRTVMKELKAQISGVLSEELDTFEVRQVELQTQQHDVFVCVKDCHRTLNQVRDQTESLVRTLQQQAVNHRRWGAERGA